MAKSVADGLAPVPSVYFSEVYFSELARLKGLSPEDPDISALRDAVEANEAAFALIDRAELIHEDPFDFVRCLRAAARGR